jgi:ABC-type amino acid transport substrate-binding protein
MKRIFLSALSVIAAWITVTSCKDEKATSALLKTHSKATTCTRGSGDCLVAIENEPTQRTQADSGVSISLKKLSDSTLQIDYIQPFESEDGGGDFFVGNDIIIPQTTCKRLGLRAIKIKAGEYKIDRSKNSLGTVIVRAIVE